MNDSPLAGCGVLITRPVQQSRELAAAVEAAGGEVISFPAIDIVGRDSQAINEDFAGLPTPDIVVFVSRNAVTHGLAAVAEHDAKIAAVGPATRDAIEQRGFAVDIFPENGFDSEHLLRHPDLQDAEGKQILIVRGQSGRELLAETLRERGAEVSYLCAYERRPHQPQPAELANLQAALDAGKVRFAIIMSAESAECLVEILPPGALDSLRQATLVAPSARVLQTASELIPGVESELAPGPQAPEIVDTLIRLAQSGQVS